MGGLIRIEVRLPQWGMGMQEARLAAWLKQVGDQVQLDEEIASLETDKAMEMLTAPGAGVLQQILVPSGHTVAVHTLLAIIVQER
jgi:pyruvate/2-oxoglutarate dehydrogenase complex dihydrolipoamide acyltransferase (E2) component